MKSVRSMLRLTSALALLFALALPAAALPVAALSQDVVISQVYGGGGNSGATLKNDFIELFNRGTVPVDVTNWSVQYASSTGSSWQKTALAGTIQPGQYYLVQQAQGAGGTTSLPTPDATGTIAMSGTNGKVALVTTNTALTCGATAGSCLSDPSIKDFVGFGSSANNFEGAGPTATLGNTTAALRGQNGCAETDNNNADFAVGAPTPRNSASPLASCSADPAPSVTSTSPASGATGVAADADVTVTFSEPVNVAGAWYTLSCATSGAHTAVVSGGPQAFTLNPDTSFSASETCTATINASQVADQDLIDPPDTMAGNHGWSFTVASPPVRIREIQGASHTSPLSNQPVSGVAGIVTARRSSGFYIQDPSPDADDATSEGIFVFTSSAPNSVNVGDSVLVSGTVLEFRPGGSSSTNSNLTTTEISSPTTVVVSTGNPLPAATIVGVGGRVPPTTIIEDDASNVETGGVFDPASDGIDFYESLEGMRVQVNDAVAVGPTNNFGEIAVVADNGANAGLRTARGGIVIQPGDFNPERVIADDEVLRFSSLASPAVHVGDRFPSLDGVLDYSFGNFKLQLTAPPAVVAGGIAREVTTVAASAPSQVSFATFNVENLSPNDTAAKFDALAAAIVTNLGAPDIVGLEEIQDNNGATNDSVVDASQTYTMLISAIQAAGGPTYQFRDIAPVDDQDGGQPGGNIRVGFLFRTDRGIAFVDRPGGSSTAATSVVSTPTGPRLSFSPGRVDPTNSAWSTSRKPLAGEFTFNGQTLFVIVNHFNSKGGDNALFGRYQPPALTSEAQRIQQANVLKGFVDSLLAADANASVVVLGDLNDFQFSAPVNILKGSLHALIETLPASERYSYIFDGNSQTLDHIMVSNNLFANVPFAYDVVHMNSEFDDQISDHDPQMVRFSFDITPPTTTATATPAANGAGWNNTNVNVALNATDNAGGSGVQDVTYSLSGAQSAAATATAGSAANVTVTAEGTTTATYFARDNADNVEPSKTLVVRIDKTAPTVTYTGNAGTYTVDQTISITCAATDALSGVASTTCVNLSGPAASLPLGANTASASATDVAGNTGTGSTTFTVRVTYDSLCALTTSYATGSGKGQVALSLCAKLQAAEAFAEREQPEWRNRAIAAYAHEVRAQTGKAFSEAQATTLMRLARALQSGPSVLGHGAGEDPSPAPSRFPAVRM